MCITKGKMRFDPSNPCDRCVRTKYTESKWIHSDTSEILNKCLPLLSPLFLKDLWGEAGKDSGGQVIWQQCGTEGGVSRAYGLTWHLRQEDGHFLLRPMKQAKEGYRCTRIWHWRVDTGQESVTGFHIIWIAQIVGEQVSVRQKPVSFHDT